MSDLPYRPRWLNRWYATTLGFFWLPCPTCGEMFGGHESDDSVQCRYRPSTYHMICRQCAGVVLNGTVAPQSHCARLRCRALAKASATIAGDADDHA